MAWPGRRACDNAPMQLDTSRLCDKAQRLEHTIVLSGRERFDDVLAGPQEPLVVELRGERKELAGRPFQRWMQLSIRGTLGLACVRCLEPMPWVIEHQCTFRLVETEEHAASLDEEAQDHDVLVGSRHFDLDDLVEQEVLMMLPPLPHHEHCPRGNRLPGLSAAQGDGAGQEPDNPAQPSPNPFAVLSKLKML